MVLTLGLWRFVREWNPEKYGLWQCDDCGSYKCVRVRKARLDADGNLDASHYSSGEGPSGGHHHHHHHRHRHHHGETGDGK